jgi:hypothetical protein
MFLVHYLEKNYKIIFKQNFHEKNFRVPKEFSVETINDPGTSYASAAKGGESEEIKEPEKQLKNAVPYMYGNASVETIRGIIHLYKTEYGFDVSQGGPRYFL